MPDDLKSHKEICDCLRIGKKTFYELLEAGLPAVLVGNAYRADAVEVREWFRGYLRQKFEGRVSNA
jgi:excisionase family DNA binding protein